MGVSAYFLQPFIREEAEEADTIETCSKIIQSRSAESSPTIVLVDAGCLHRLWVSALKSAAHSLDNEVFRSGDFLTECHAGAMSIFARNRDSLLDNLLDNFQAVYVIWDNPVIFPEAKRMAHESRRLTASSQRDQFLHRLAILLKSTPRAQYGKKQAEQSTLARHIPALFKSVPLPSVVAREDEEGFSWTRLARRSITHVVAKDEADLAVARAADARTDAVVFTSDADVFAMVTCPVIRYFGRKFEVIPGRRSMKEIATMALIGNDCSNGQGCPDLSWGYVADHVNEAIDVLQAEDPAVGSREPDAVQICRQVLKSFTISEDEQAVIVQSAEIWQEKSHGDKVYARAAEEAWDSEGLRQQALSMDVATALQVTLPFPLLDKSGEKKKPNKGRKASKARCRLPGRTQNDLKPLCVQPMQQHEPPQYSDEVLRNRQQQAGSVQQPGKRLVEEEVEAGEATGRQIREAMLAA